MSEKYVIIKGTNVGEPVFEDELVGYDDETGYEIYEEVLVDFLWKPKEDVIEVFESFEKARSRYNQLVDEYEDTHQWPWNNGHFTIENGVITTEFTDNEYSVWLKLQKQ